MSDNPNQNTMTKTSETSETTETTETTKTASDQFLFLNQSYFVYAVVNIVTMLKAKSLSMQEENKVPAAKTDLYKKLVATCTDIIAEYKTTPDANTTSITPSQSNTSSVDQVKIIKKCFYVLKDNLELIKSKSPDLFKVRNELNKITTIIPGVNINLLYEFLDEPEQKLLWTNIYTLFISSVSMVYANTPESRHKVEITEMVEYCRKDIASSSSITNVFMGLCTNNAEINMDSLMSNDIIIPGTEANSGLLGSLGIDKLMNLNNLSEEIKKFSDDDVTETVNTLGELLGNDSDVKDVCATMVKSVIDDLKVNGIENMFDIAQRVSSKLGGLIDPAKMAKTAHKMGDLMTNNSDKIKELKDENGNPIGDQFLKQFQSTLDAAKRMSGAKA